MASELVKVLKAAPNSTKVSLDRAGVTRVHELMTLLCRFPNLRVLSLRGNKISSLPNDLSSLRTVETLDLSSNPIQSASSVLQGLASLPSLRHLSISLPSQREEEEIVLGLPRLESINGTTYGGYGRTSSPQAGKGGAVAQPAADVNEPPPAVREVSMTEDDLEEVAVLYGGLKELQTGTNPQLDEPLTAAFDNHVQDTMRVLSSRLDKQDDPFLRQGEIIEAKYRLFDVCVRNCVEHANSTSPDFGDVLRRIRDVHNRLMEDFSGVIKQMRPHYVHRLKNVQAELARSETESSQLLEAAELLEREAEQLRTTNARLEKELARERSKHRDTPPAKASPVPRSQQATNLPVAAVPKIQNASASDPTHSGAIASAIPSVVERQLTLKQLVEVIESIYASKEKFDKKCSDAKLPRETMEQHMYTYLNQKYGLKTLIVEHASSIIRAVHQFSEENNDVCVFGRILQNEIDEEFRFVQRTVKDTVVELLRVFLKGVFPKKTDDAITNLLQQRLHGVLSQDEWIDIVKYMYDRDDSISLIATVRDFIDTNPALAAATDGTSRGKSRRERARADAAAAQAIHEGRIRFNDFLKILLDFQLSGHERFLHQFRVLFRQFDSDNNGVLNEAELRELIRSLDPTKTPDKIAELVNQVDPYANQHITFSEAVAALSPDLVRLFGRTGNAGDMSPREGTGRS